MKGCIFEKPYIYFLHYIYMEDISMVATIISVALLVIALVVVLLNALLGFLGKNSKSLAKLSVILISTIVSVLLTKLIAFITAKSLLPAVKNFAGQYFKDDIDKVLPSFDSVATGLTIMISAPFVFLIVFFIVRLVLSLTLKKVFTKLYDKIHPFFEKEKHYLGPIVGLVSGLLIVTVWFVPLSGFINVANDTVNAVNAPEEVSDIVGGVAKSPAVKVTYGVGGKLIFNGLTSVKIDGHRTNLNKESSSLIGMVDGVTTLTSKDFSKFGPDESEAIKNVSGSFGDSVIVPTIAADILSGASDSWSEGGEFMGKKAPSMGEAFDDFTTDLYGILKTTDYDTVRSDVDCIAFIMCQFIDHGVFSGDDMLAAMSQEGLISTIVEKLYEYDRMAPLVPSVTNVGFNMIGDALGIPKDDQQIYDELMADIAEEVMKAKQLDGDLNAKAESLKNGIATAYVNAGVEVPKETISIIAPGLLGYFENDGEISASDVADFYAELDRALAEKVPDTTGVAFGGVVMIAANAKSDILSAIADHLVYGESESEALKGYAMVTEYVPSEENVNKVRKLASSQTMESTKITLVQLKTSSADIPADAESRARDAKNIEQLIVKMTELKDVDTSSVENVVGQIGGMLDSMSGMSTIGHDKTKDFLAAVLQSETVSNTTGWTPSEALDVSDKLSQNAQKGEGGYEQIMNGVGNGVAYVNIAFDDTKTVEERREALHELLVNLDQATVDSVESVLTPSLLVKQGAKEGDPSTANSIDAVNLLLANMLKAKENGMSEDDYLKEVDAIDSVMMIALSNTKTSSKEFFGENGSTGSKSDEIIAKVVDSVVVSDSLIEFCYDGETLKQNPLEMKNNNESEMAKFRADLVDCYNARIGNFAAGSAEAVHFTKTINAFAALMNVEKIV